ncbi:MAG: 3-dehydroquinate synthase [Victivallaceae bacterium]
MKHYIKIPVNLGERSYDIIIGSGLINNSESYLESFAGEKKCLTVTDSNVGPLYERHLRKILIATGADNSDFIFPAGEENKTMDTITAICRQCVLRGLDRKSLIIALGGGVCGDMAGFSAAVYMRGIDFIQIPTTLLAAVDSSVGGKTGVDLPEGKNLVGAFWQPKLVLMDTTVLNTLPEKEIRCGLAEVVKYGVIMDKDFFAKLENNVDRIKALDLEFYAEIIARCCELKAQVVTEDEHENGIRAILNYGHTFGHAVELLSDFKMSHGEAVAVGMNMAMKLSALTGMVSESEAARQKELLLRLGLPCSVPASYKPDEILAAMGRDKKKVGSKLKLVLPVSIGEVKVTNDISHELILQAIRCCCD